MALPPTIPTSFVPKQITPAQQRRARPQVVIFHYITFFVMLAVLVGAGATFAYDTYLNTVRAAKQQRLETIEQNLDATAVEDLIRLRDRITVADMLLERHIVSSQFFDVLERVTLQNVRFQSLQFSVDNTRTASIEMRGTARSFNALAAQSSALAAEKDIRRAIFSGITADKNGLVKFALQAEIHPKLITLSTAPHAATAPESEPMVPFEAAAPTASTTTP